MTSAPTVSLFPSPAPAGESTLLSDLMRVLSASPFADAGRRAAEALSQRVGAGSQKAETQGLAEHMRSLAHAMEVAARLEREVVEGQVFRP